MDLNDIPLLAGLQKQFAYLNARQQVIAQNVANASTPGYTPSDLKPFAAQPGLAVDGTVAPAAPLALAAAGGASPTAVSLQRSANASGPYPMVSAPDSETTLNGNQVVLEEQMMKMSDTGSDYDTAIGLYQKALGLLHLANGKPGG